MKKALLSIGIMAVLIYFIQTLKSKKAKTL